MLHRGDERRIVPTEAEGDALRASGWTLHHGESSGVSGPSSFSVFVAADPPAPEPAQEPEDDGQDAERFGNLHEPGDGGGEPEREPAPVEHVVERRKRGRPKVKK